MTVLVRFALIVFVCSGSAQMCGHACMLTVGACHSNVWACVCAHSRLLSFKG